MPVKFGVDPEDTKAPKPVPGNQWYDLQLKELTCKKNKAGDSFNYNAVLEVVDNKTELNGSRIYFLMPLKGSFSARKVLDFSHGFGLHLDADGTLPGGQAAWKVDPKDPEMKEAKTIAQYQGVLIGRKIHAEVVITKSEGYEEKNQLKQITCKVPGCATKHPDIKHLNDLVGKNG